MAFDWASAVSVTAPSDTPVARADAMDHLYRQGEAIFRVVGPELVANGWSVFPQERTDRRGPARIGGAALKWKEFQERLPTAEEVADWALQCPSHNLAIITGPASGNIFALDIDVSEHRLAWSIRELATEFLGDTPMKRVGRDPRIVLVYRTSQDVKLGKRAYRLVGTDPNGAIVPSGDAIEILANGSPFTAYGKHHKTGRYFKWLGTAEPKHCSPEVVPLVTTEMLAAFLVAVQNLRPFYKNAPALAVAGNWEYDAQSGLQVPKLEGGANNWVEDAQGIVVDGRESYLWTLARQTVRANVVEASRGAEGEARLMALVAETFKQRALMSDKWDEVFLRSQVAEKVQRLCQWARENNVRPLRTKVDAAGVPTIAPGQVTGAMQPPERAPVEGLDSLTFIRKSNPLVDSSERTKLQVSYDPNATPDAKLREERRLTPSRAAIAAKVDLDIGLALDAFFDEVYEEGRQKRIHVLKAPTGAGKTSKTIHRIGCDPRTKSYDEARARGEDVPGPILFLLPTYNNIEELRLRADVLNLDGSLDDDDLEAQARERGLVKEDELDARVGDLRRDAVNAGLRAMTYKGKLAAGCKMVDKMKLLMESGVGTSGLCKSVKKDDEGKSETVLCEHYAGCPAIEQRKQIIESHVVFLPHAFLTLTIPEELKAVRAVVADERVFHLFVHTTSFLRTTLKLGRKKPTLTSTERRALKEKAEGAIQPEDLMTDRNVAADRAAAALQRGACPARALHEAVHVYPNGQKVPGIELVRHAKRVCGNAIMSGVEITPETTLNEIRELCSMPTGTEVREEWRFWAIIEDRMEALAADALHASLLESAKANLSERAEAARLAGTAEPTGDLSAMELAWRPRAKGARDARIQLLLEEQDDGIRVERIRLSWRSKPNWAGAPLLLLDASASPDIIGKIFNERTVVVHDVDAPLNVRTVAVVDKTYSNSSIVSAMSRSSKERLVAGRMKNSLRCAISAISSLYGWGRVVCGAGVVVRKAINEAWKQPTNVDWCHFGAMRGLDFAKHHAAALSIGRMEVPIKVIDGLVAALSYDDEEPEIPYDFNGDNVGPDGKPLMLPFDPQVVKMRSGHDVVIPVPRFPGAWARKVQEQYREEELSQFLGRLRPVYREGEAPVWFAVSKVVPSHVIVDEVISIQELVGKPHKGRYIRATLWDAIRMADGVAHPELLAAANPTTYKDAQSARLDMKLHGFDIENGTASMEQRSTWGFTPVRVAGPDAQDATWAFVRTELGDVATAIRGSFARHLGRVLGHDQIVAGTPTRRLEAGVRRTPDWVDDLVGEMEDRADAEHVGMAESAVWAVENMAIDAFLLPTGAPKSLPLEMRQSEGEVGGMNFTLQDIAATRSTDAMWAKARAGHAQEGKVVEPGANYEHLGDGAEDPVLDDYYAYPQVSVEGMPAGAET